MPRWSRAAHRNRQLRRLVNMRHPRTAPRRLCRDKLYDYVRTGKIAVARDGTYGESARVGTRAPRLRRSPLGVPTLLTLARSSTAPTRALGEIRPNHRTVRRLAPTTIVASRPACSGRPLTRAPRIGRITLSAWMLHSKSHRLALPRVRTGATIASGAS